MEFQHAYHGFIRSHVKRRSGPGAIRIKSGLEHAELKFLENVWWPAFRHFDALHPEYQVHDFKDGHRYIDFAYIQPNFRVAIEIDGFGSHWQNISQVQFSDHCHRQNHLVIDGWHVLRFSFADVIERPRVCQQTIQQLIGRLTSDPISALRTLNIIDREIMRLALGLNRPITARDVTSHVDMGRDAAARHLKRLSESDWLEPASGTMRIRSYRVHPSRTNLQL